MPLTVVPRKIAEELQLPVIGKRVAVTAKGSTELDERAGVVEVMDRKAHTHTCIRRHSHCVARRNNT